MRVLPPFWIRSYQRPGRLVPSSARGIRSRSIQLKVGEWMMWHSTQDREELVIALRGRLIIEARRNSSAIRQLRLTPGQCLFLPRQTWHRIGQRGHQTAQYLYVTAPANSR